MSKPAEKGEPKTLEEWLALPEGTRFELIDGELVKKTTPTFDHGTAQALTAGLLAGSFHHRSGGPGRPGVRAAETETVRAEPFDAIEIEVRVLLGGDPS